MELPHAYAPRIYFVHSVLVGPLAAWPALFAHAASLGFDHVLIGALFAPGRSGDGRIVFTALRANAKARGIGVDIDEKLVRESNADAKKFGMADRVQFHMRDVFDTDLKPATVITMWLWPEMQRMLRTKILAEARPGTRVLTNIWDLGTWPADKVEIGRAHV